jgi:hypothetical protein
METTVGRAKLNGLGVAPMSMTPTEFDSYVKDEIARKEAQSRPEIPT